MKNQTEKTPVPLTEMTLRDFFAVQSMQAIISKSPLTQTDSTLNKQNRVALGSYSYADAMLEARK
jgi:hypothetical protein